MHSKNYMTYVSIAEYFGSSFKYTLKSKPKALAGDKSEGIKSRGVAETFIRGFIPG